MRKGGRKRRKLEASMSKRNEYRKRGREGRVVSED